MWFLTLFQCCTFTGIISLHTNQLSGPIPSDLGSLSSLREFYMAPDGVWCSYYIVLPLCLFANVLALFVSCPFSNVVHLQNPLTCTPTNLVAPSQVILAAWAAFVSFIWRQTEYDARITLCYLSAFLLTVLLCLFLVPFPMSCIYRIPFLANQPT